MVSLDADWTNPVARFAVLSLVAGLALIGVGLYRTLMTGHSCGPATAGCGDSFGFVFVVWGVPLVAVSAVALVGRVASRNH